MEGIRYSAYGKKEIYRRHIKKDTSLSLISTLLVKQQQQQQNPSITVSQYLTGQ